MNYTKIKIKDNEYKFRLTVEKACELEDDLNKNPLLIFAAEMPRISDLRKVFMYAGGTDQLF